MNNTLSIQRKALRVIFHTEFRADVRDKFIEYRLKITTTLYTQKIGIMTKKLICFPLNCTDVYSTAFGFALTW